MLSGVSVPRSALAYEIKGERIVGMRRPSALEACVWMTVERIRIEVTEVFAR